MWKQNNLFGNPLKVKEGKKPWEGICTESCYNAKEEKCVCRCHGAFHGLGSLNKEHDPSEKVLPETEAQEFRKLYKNPTCHCGADLRKEPILYYVPHENGWNIKCEKEKAWLYVKCPKCGYDMSIWKIGVPRE